MKARLLNALLTLISTSLGVSFASIIMYPILGPPPAYVLGCLTGLILGMTFHSLVN